MCDRRRQAALSRAWTWPAERDATVKRSSLGGGSCGPCRTGCRTQQAWTHAGAECAAALGATCP
eukprot:7674928-Pyramimonas_sp.AAC.1